MKYLECIFLVFIALVAITFAAHATPSTESTVSGEETTKAASNQSCLVTSVTNVTLHLTVFLESFVSAADCLSNTIPGGAVIFGIPLNIFKMWISVCINVINIIRNTIIAFIGNCHAGGSASVSVSTG